MKKLIDEFLDHERSKGRKSLSTIMNYQRYLNRFGAFTGEIKPEEITIELIDRFQKEIAKSACLSTQSYYLISIRVFLKWLRIRKDLQVLEPLKIELPRINRRVRDALSAQEADSLLKSAIPQRRQGIRDRLVLELLLGSGIRVSELTGLKIDDFNLENKTALVTGKGNKMRQIYLTDSAIHFVKKHLQVRGCKSKYVFNTRGGKEKITTRSIQRLIRKLAKKALIKRKMTPHNCRHYFASKMLNHGLNIRQVQVLLGHSSIATTEIYTHVTDPELKKAFSQAQSSFCNKPDGMPYKNEFIIISKNNFYKLIGGISKNRQLLLQVCDKLGVKPH